MHQEKQDDNSASKLIFHLDEAASDGTVDHPETQRRKSYNEWQEGKEYELEVVRSESILR